MLIEVPSMADGVKAVKEDSPLRRSTRRRNGATVCTFLESNNRPTESASDVCFTRRKGIDQLLKRMVGQRTGWMARQKTAKSEDSLIQPLLLSVQYYSLLQRHLLSVRLSS